MPRANQSVFVNGGTAVDRFALSQRQARAASVALCRRRLLLRRCRRLRRPLWPGSFERRWSRNGLIGDRRQVTIFFPTTVHASFCFDGGGIPPLGKLVLV